MKKYYLTKINENGSPQFWEAIVDGNKVTTRWGLNGGKVQTKVTEYNTTKNAGRANEKSPEDVALFDTEVTARRKIEKGYSLTIGELTTVSDTVKVANTNIPNAMLAKKYRDYEDKVKSYQKIWVQPKLDGCLSGNTIVELKNHGKLKLKDVVDNKIKDKIKSFDIKNNKVIFSNICGYGKDIPINEKIDWFLITLKDGTTIKATGNHLFYIKKIKAFRRVDELKEGDFLFIDK